MKTISVKGRTLKVGENGFLANVDDWNKDVAEYFAEQEGIHMSEQHWEVANYLNEYYKQYQIAPMVKIIVKEWKKNSDLKKAIRGIFTISILPARQARHARLRASRARRAVYRSRANLSSNHYRDFKNNGMRVTAL